MRGARFGVFLDAPGGREALPGRVDGPGLRRSALIFPSGFALKAKKDLLMRYRHRNSRLGRCGKLQGRISRRYSQGPSQPHPHCWAPKISSLGAPQSCARAAGRANRLFVAVHKFAALRESLRNSTQISGKSSVSRYALRQRADGVREPRSGLISLAQAPSASRGG